MSNKENFDNQAYEEQLAEFEPARNDAQAIVNLYNSTPLLPLQSSEEFYGLFSDYEQLIYEKLQAAGNWAGVISADQVSDIATLTPLCDVLAQRRAEGIQNAARLKDDPLLAEFNEAIPHECRMATACESLFDFENGQVVFKSDFIEGLKSCFTN